VAASECPFGVHVVEMQHEHFLSTEPAYFQEFLGRWRKPIEMQRCARPTLRFRRSEKPSSSQGILRRVILSIGLVQNIGQVTSGVRYPL